MAPWVMSLEAMIPGIEQSLGAPENPVARDAQATIYDDNGGTSTMQAFSFDTSQVRLQKPHLVILALRERGGSYK